MGGQHGFGAAVWPTIAAKLHLFDYRLLFMLKANFIDYRFNKLWFMLKASATTESTGGSVFQLSTGVSICV